MQNRIYAMDTHFMCANQGPDLAVVRRHWRAPCR